MFSKADTIKVRTRYLSFPLLPKMKSVHFKTSNDIYPSDAFLSMRLHLDSNAYTFYLKDIESQEVFFFTVVLLLNPTFDYNIVKFSVFIQR